MATMLAQVIRNLNNHPVVDSDEPESTEQKEEKEELTAAAGQQLQKPRKLTTQMHNGILDNAKQIIAAAHEKIRILNERCTGYKRSNESLETELQLLRHEEKEKELANQRYKSEIDSQTVILTNWKEKMQQLSQEIIVIREKAKQQQLTYANKLLSISADLHKVHGDNINKLKYNKMKKKFVVFTEGLNQLFYYDDAGLKLVFVRGVSVTNETIDAQISGKPWFFIIGKKRSVLFITPSIEIRDKWLHFINRSLSNIRNLCDSDDEISVLTSLVSVDYDLESKSNDVHPSYANYANQYAHYRGTTKQNNSSTLLSLARGQRLKTPRKKIRSVSLASTIESYNEKIHVMVMYDIKPDKLELFLTTMRKLIVATNEEKGCIKFNMHKERNCENKFVMMEVWESQKYLTSHLQQQHLQMYRNIINTNDVHNRKPNVFFCQTLL